MNWKKLWIAVGLLLVIGFVAVYFIIPNQISVSKDFYIASNKGPIERQLLQRNNYSSWLPQVAGVSSNNNQSFTHNNYTYTYNQQQFSSGIYTITGQGLNQQAKLTLISKGYDSTIAQWRMQFESTANPFTKIGNYFKAVKFKKQLDILCASFQNYFGTVNNAYGIPITLERVTDSLLISTNASFATYPTTEQIYSLIQKLEQHTQLHKAELTNNPMLFIEERDGKTYYVQVALPIKSSIPLGSGMVEKQLLKNGLMLTALANGDGKFLKQAAKDLSLFADDYDKTSPAIPYEMLITNRLQEKDSTKWQTKLFYPIF
jgi:hypothetical protein